MINIDKTMQAAADRFVQLKIVQILEQLWGFFLETLIWALVAVLMLRIIVSYLGLG